MMFEIKNSPTWMRWTQGGMEVGSHWCPSVREERHPAGQSIAKKGKTPDCGGQQLEGEGGYLGK